MNTVAIQPQEISFAAPSTQTPAAQEPSQSFQQMLSSVNNGLSDESGDSGAPVTQGAQEGKESEKTSVITETPAYTAAVAALFSLTNPQAAQEPKAEESILTASPVAPNSGIGGLTVGSDTASMTRQLSTAVSQNITKAQTAVPGEQMPQSSDAADLLQNGIQTEKGDLRAAIVFTGEMPAEVTMKGKTRETGLLETLQKAPGESIPTVEVGMGKAASAPLDKTVDLKPVHYSDSAPAENSAIPKMTNEPPSASKAEVTGTGFVQNGQVQIADKKVQAHQGVSEVPPAETQTEKVEAADLTPAQHKDAVQGEKPKITENQPISIQATNTAIAKPQPLPDGKEAGKTGETQGPLAAGQIAQGVHKALKEGVTEFSLKLKPEGLGQVTVRVTGEKKTLVLDIQAESGATQKLISEQVGKLTADLCGGRYESVDVRIGGQTTNNSANTGFSKDGGGQKYSESRQYGQSFAESKETSGRPLRFFAGGMLNCTA